MRSVRFVTLVLVALAFMSASASARGVLSHGQVGNPVPYAELGCPSHSNPHGIKLWIHVTHWCAEPGVRGQAQFKLQMRIHNQSKDHDLDVALERMRLIVRVFDPRHWTPAPGTYERPIATRYDGETVWEVPPNAEDAADPIPGIPGDYTFATHWKVSILGPEETLNPHFHYGDLVFYVPSPHHGIGALDNVVGMAYVDGPEIIALCHPANWGPRISAEKF